MPAPRELSQQIPASGKSYHAKLQGGGKVLVQIPGVRAAEGGGGGGRLWMKLIPELHCNVIELSDHPFY